MVFSLPQKDRTGQRKVFVVWFQCLPVVSCLANKDANTRVISIPILRKMKYVILKSPTVYAVHDVGQHTKKIYLFDFSEKFRSK